MLHLLPQNHKKLVLIEYRKRLLTVISVAFIVVCVMGMIFLVPSYFISETRYQDLKNKNDVLEASTLASEKSVDAGIVKQISQGVSVLKPLGSTLVPSMVFNRFLADVSNQDVKVSYMDYLPNSDDSVTLDISATAGTRDELQTFIDGLKQDAYFSGVSLPLSDFIKDTNIVFSLKMRAVDASATSTAPAVQ